MIIHRYSVDFWKNFKRRGSFSCRHTYLSLGNRSILLVCFGLVVFYGISTLVEYLMPNHVLYTHNTSTNICGTSSTIMTNFNERTNTLLYKNIISHTLFLKEWCWLCVRDELETVDGLLYWPQVLQTIAALLPHLGWGCSTVGHWGPQALSLQADSHAGILSRTDSNRLCPGYIIFSRPLGSAVLLIYTGASLDWRLGRGSVYHTCLYIYMICKQIVCW